MEIPRDYDVEVAINQVRAGSATDELVTTGVQYLPFVTATSRFYDECGSEVTRGLYRGRTPGDGTYVLAIQPPPVPPRFGCGRPLVESRDLLLIGSEAEWPSTGYTPGTLGEAGRSSNITNAVGFLGGVLSRAIPYEECDYLTEGAPVPPYCRLRYGPETATLTGTVRETFCGDGLTDSVTVRLTETGRDPARVRTVLSTRAGGFVIGALEPGIPHALWARAPQVPSDSVFDLRTFRYIITEWKDVHTLPTDTLTFVADQRVEYDIDLQRLTPCNEPPPRAR